MRGETRGRYRGQDRRPWSARVVALLAVALAALALQPLTAMGTHEAGTAEFSILAVEYKGTAGSNEVNLAEGVVVSGYMWTPNSLEVNQGDRVILNIYGVNGREHPSTITGPTTYQLSYRIYPLEIDGDRIKLEVANPLSDLVAEATDVTSFSVWRGHLTVVEFVADTPGTFTIHCAAHAPTMDATLVVGEPTPAWSAWSVALLVLVAGLFAAVLVLVLRRTRARSQ